jgi:hypothetical protein
VGFMGFGRKGFGQMQFGRKQSGNTPSGYSSHQNSSTNSSPFERLFNQLEHKKDDRDWNGKKTYSSYQEMAIFSPEERGELLADLADRPGVYGGCNHEVPKEKAAYNAYNVIWNHEIAVKPEHLGALLSLLTGNKSFRERSYYEASFGALIRLINSAIKQGGFLTSSDCETLAQMAVDIRSVQKSYSKADTKKMIARAEKLEKLAGVEVSATEFLMERCEGADNPWVIANDARPNAQFWADLLAETTHALEEIRTNTKGGAKPVWMRNADAFAAAWPACGDVEPKFAVLKDREKPFYDLSQHNGKRTGFADPEAYRKLPQFIALAQAHSRYDWSSTQIPGLDIIADLENPDWTALVEKLITQRRATKATAAWQKQVLALCQSLGIAKVEGRLHNWLALFHSPALDMRGYTNLCNGERFASCIDRLEAGHPDWPMRYAHEIKDLGRAVAMKIASGDNSDVCGMLHSQLIRQNDIMYKNTRVTDGLLGLARAHYNNLEGHRNYYSIASAMRVSVENEEFLRGAVWLVSLMPDRMQAINALEKTAQTAATYVSTGDEGMRSKIVANAAIATMIAMGGSDIDAAVLRLSKVIDNCTINPPLFKYLNGEH